MEKYALKWKENIKQAFLYREINIFPNFLAKITFLWPKSFNNSSNPLFAANDAKTHRSHSSRPQLILVESRSNIWNANWWKYDSQIDGNQIQKSMEIGSLDIRTVRGGNCGGNWGACTFADRYVPLQIHPLIGCGGGALPVVVVLVHLGSHKIQKYKNTKIQNTNVQCYGQL